MQSVDCACKLIDQMDLDSFFLNKDVGLVGKGLSLNNVYREPSYQIKSIHHG